jgi:TRAP-type C4-dicarboxylate transport system permease small subunit
MTGTFALAAVQMAWDSYEYNELAQGQLAVPMWIPQASMALGAAILFVAVLDATFHVCRGIAPAYDRKRTDDPIAQLRVET